MMDCHRVKELFEDFSVGALRPADGGAVERHLRECSPCSREFAADRLLDDILSKQRHEGLSADFTERLLRNFRQERVYVAVSPLRVLESIGYAASAAALLYGFTKYLGGTDVLHSTVTASVDATREVLLVQSAWLEGQAVLWADAFGQVGVLPVSAAVGASIMIWGLYTLLEGGGLGYNKT